MPAYFHPTDVFSAPWNVIASPLKRKSPPHTRAQAAATRQTNARRRERRAW